MKPEKELRQRLKEINFYDEIDEDLKYFCRNIRQDLRNEYDHVIAVTGYPGVGKSQATSVISTLIDFDYSFKEHVLFIPTSKNIENKYYELPMYSVLHIDEASRGLHKQKWYEKVQQTLNQLYDTERENHFLCSFLIMPRFQNFTENFRNFRIKYWIHLTNRGIGIVYIRDEDKDTKDPWHLDENSKLKQKKWRGKRIAEREINDIVRMEQRTKNYFFYFTIPEIPKEIWKEYQELKKQSREKMKEEEKNMEVESYKEKIEREKMDKWCTIKDMKNKRNTNNEIAAVLGCSGETVRRHLRSMEAYEKMKGEIKIASPQPTGTNKILYNQYDNGNNDEIPEEFDKI